MAKKLTPVGWIVLIVLGYFAVTTFFPDTFASVKSYFEDVLPGDDTSKEPNTIVCDVTVERSFFGALGAKPRIKLYSCHQEFQRSCIGKVEQQAFFDFLRDVGTVELSANSRVIGRTTYEVSEKLVNDEVDQIIVKGCTRNMEGQLTLRDENGVLIETKNVVI